MRLSDITLYAHQNEIPRWSGVPTIQKQNVAEHVFNVVWIAQLFAERSAFVLQSPAHYRMCVYEFSVRHDLFESITGDPPSPFKQANKQSFVDLEADLEDPEYAVDHEIYLIVKLADILEAIMFVEKEVKLGNKNVGKFLTELRDRFDKVWRQFDWDDLNFGNKPPGVAVIRHFCDRCARSAVYIGVHHPFNSDNFWKVFDRPPSVNELPF